MKQFVALARVSSREQEREGFSLDVQVEGLKRYAAGTGGEIVKLFRIAETASKTEERRTFRELIAFAKKHFGPIERMTVDQKQHIHSIICFGALYIIFRKYPNHHIGFRYFVQFYSLIYIFNLSEFSKKYLINTSKHICHI
jgi:hypothetical protein